MLVDNLRLPVGFRFVMIWQDTNGTTSSKGRADNGPRRLGQRADQEGHEIRF